VHQAELEMQNEELRLAVDKAATATALYDFAPSGYFALNGDSVIIQLNLSGAKLLGKERSRLISSNIKQYIARDTLLIFHDFFLKIFETNSKQECEVRLIIQGNPSIFVHLEGIISENEQNCLLTMVNITDRKQTNEALRESEERYRLLFDNSLDAILLTSTDGIIFEINPSACQLFERNLQEFRQVGRNGIVDTTDPRLAAALQERDRTGKFIGELTLIRKDGTKFPGKVSMGVYIDKNGIIKTSMIVHDNSNRGNI
jgi:PAS domain S-box-containing protein